MTTETKWLPNTNEITLVGYNALPHLAGGAARRGGNAARMKYRKRYEISAIRNNACVARIMKYKFSHRKFVLWRSNLSLVHNVQRTFHVPTGTFHIIGSFVCKRRRHLQAKPELIHTVLPCVSKVSIVTKLTLLIYEQSNNTCI